MKRGAAVHGLAWVTLAAGCCGLFWALHGASVALAFAGAYLSELALSFDNVAAFVAIFLVLGLGPEAQRRVLLWGLLGALVTRAALIAAATTVTVRWAPASVILGGLLVVSAAWTLVSSRRGPSRSRLAGTLSRRLHSAPVQGSFFVREAGRVRPTLLVAAVLAVELTDAVCSLDSIPTALAVTNDPWTLYSSNVLAVAALRAPYGLLVDVPLEGAAIVGLATLLVSLAGIKLLLAPWWRPAAPWVTPAVFGASGLALGAAVVLRARSRRALTASENGATQSSRTPRDGRKR